MQLKLLFLLQIEVRSTDSAGELVKQAVAVVIANESAAMSETFAATTTV